MKKIPRVGLAALVLQKGKILLGKRYSTIGKSTWGPPGGHLEFAETLTDGAKRELKEETNLLPNSIQFITITEEVYEELERHYVTIWFEVVCKSGVPKITEPDRIGEWTWFDWRSEERRVGKECRSR